uniref:Peroxiredoxin like 2B n=1 Tax=Cyprinus carpio carpio TaxID=630221 RepID=A0A8C1H957_CYPCA
MSSVNLTSLGANQVKNTTSGEQTIQCYMVEIGSLWREQTVVLFFLQRFGCQVYFEKHMIFFSFLFKYIYIDEKKQCYKDLGFKRYEGTSAMGKSVRNCLKEGICGNRGDLLQSGGMLIVAKGGEKVLLHFAGEKPQVKQEEFVRSSLFDTGI